MSAVPDAVNPRGRPSVCARHPCACHLGGTGPAVRAASALASTTTSTTSRHLDSYLRRYCQSRIIRNRRANINILPYCISDAESEIRSSMRVWSWSRLVCRNLPVLEISYALPRAWRPVDAAGPRTTTRTRLEILNLRAVVALRPWTTAHRIAVLPNMRLSTASTGPTASENFFYR